MPGIDDILYHGYTDVNGNTVMPATEKMKRGATALSAFKDYRAARNKSPERADSALRVFEEHKAYFGYGYIQKVEDLIPPLGMVYWSFRIMVGAGFALILVMALLIGTAAKARSPRSAGCSTSGFGVSYSPISPNKPDGLWPKWVANLGPSKTCSPSMPLFRVCR